MIMKRKRLVLVTRDFDRNSMVKVSSNMEFFPLAENCDIPRKSYMTPSNLHAERIIT
jgi:hypothetical protein